VLVQSEFAGADGRACGVPARHPVAARGRASWPQFEESSASDLGSKGSSTGFAARSSSAKASTVLPCPHVPGRDGHVRPPPARPGDPEIPHDGAAHAQDEVLHVPGAHVHLEVFDLAEDPPAGADDLEPPQPFNGNGSSHGWILVPRSWTEQRLRAILPRRSGIVGPLRTTARTVRSPRSTTLLTRSAMWLDIKATGSDPLQTRYP